MYPDDEREFADQAHVTVHDVATMNPEKIRSVLGSDGTVIGGFCNTGARFGDQIP